MEQENTSIQAMMEFLKKPEIQSSLQARLHEVSAQVKTSIGQVAKIVGISQTQLRYWEEKSEALLAPRRSRSGAPVVFSPPQSTETPEEQSQKTPGQRLYSIDDLKRLIVIKALLDQSYSLTDIALLLEQYDPLFELDVVQPRVKEAKQQRSILEHIRQVKVEHAPFWGFFVPRVLYLTLSFLFAGPPEGDAGVFLPIIEPTCTEEPLKIDSLEDLSKLGRTLFSWHQRGYSSYTFLSTESKIPDSPERYKLIALDELAATRGVTNAYVVVEQSMAPLVLKARPEACRVAQRLLQLLQQHAEDWIPLLEEGSNYMTYHASSMITPTLGDPLLTDLADKVVELGGKLLSGDQSKPRWRFCCFLEPQNPLAPMHQRELVVTAQSSQSPHKPGETKLLNGPQTSLSERAYQSGHIIYRPNVTSEDTAIANIDQEAPLHSAIAVPIAGFDGQPIAVLYAISDEAQAFSPEDHLLLRTIERIASELILSANARNMLANNLKKVIERPGIVDLFYEAFASENTFMQHLEKLLGEVVESKTPPFEALSFIAIDLDNLTTIADKFGDWAPRDLVREVGMRIQGQTRALSKKPEDIHLYRIFGDKFYLILRNMQREKAVELAEELSRVLKQPYQVHAARFSHTQPASTDNMLNLQHVTARFGVTSYDYTTLSSWLQRDPSIANVRAKMTRTLDAALDLGKGRGGNTIIAWHPQVGMAPLAQKADLS